MDDDEPHFLMSLNDTLTCGFGAAVLLFVVFVILVSLRSGASASREEARPLQRPSASVDRSAGAVEPPLLVHLRAHCDFTATVNGDDWKTMRFEDGRPRAGNTCVTLFLSEKPRNAIVAFHSGSTAAPEGVVTVTVFYGAEALTPAGGARLKCDASEWRKGNAVFEIAPGDPREPFRCVTNPPES